MWMKMHFQQIEESCKEASVRLPNRVFRDLTREIKKKNGKTSIQQISFAYTYLVASAFLYRYASFIDLENKTYIQNGDMKELLGYSRKTKTINDIIKKGGVLDEMGLTRTVPKIPIGFIKNPDEKINNVSLIEFYIYDSKKFCEQQQYNYNKIKNIVKNKNYEIKEPLFLTHGYEDLDYGTLYTFENTHQITISEFMSFAFDEELNNIDFLMYSFFKSKCKGYKNNQNSIALYKIVSEIGIDKDTFYNHLKILKQKGFISVEHSSWVMVDEGAEAIGLEANKYTWRGVAV